MLFSWDVSLPHLSDVRSLGCPPRSKAFVRVTSCPAGSDGGVLRHDPIFDVENVVAGRECLNVVSETAVDRETNDTTGRASASDIAAIYVIADFRSISGHSLHDWQREENRVLIKRADRRACPSVQVFQVNRQARHEGENRHGRD